jgi:hypothetical protein
LFYTVLIVVKLLILALFIGAIVAAVYFSTKQQES